MARDRCAGARRRLVAEEANSCIGEPELFKQDSGVDVTRPDMLDDPARSIRTAAKTSLALRSSPRATPLRSTDHARTRR